MPLTRSKLQYTPAEWRWFDAQVIDPASIEQVGNVAAILNINMGRVLDAIKAGNKTGGAIRKWLAANPVKRRRV